MSAATVSAEDRHSKARPCPICAGYKEMDQGKGERCWGFVGDSLRVFCTRLDNPHVKSKSEDAEMHFLDGRCQCGQSHADGSNPNPAAWKTKGGDWLLDVPPKPTKKTKTEEPPKPWSHNDSAIETIYPYTNDQGGEYTVEVVRFTDAYRESRPGLPKTLPRYRTDQGFLAGLPSAIGKTDGCYLYKQHAMLDALRMGYALHICEGEKDADRASSAGLCATTNICGALGFKQMHAEIIAEAWLGAGKDSEVFLILDRDDAGLKRGERIADRLIEAGLPAARIRAVQSATAGDGDDLTNHLDAGFGPDDLEHVDLEVLVRVENEQERDAGAERFDADQTSISFVFDSEPPPREYLIEDLMPANESGLLVAAGGTGKGHLQIQLALSMAMGGTFSGMAITKPRGVVLVSVEDDRHELHRRLRAALDLWFSDSPPGTMEKCRPVLERRIRIVDLRGTTFAKLGSQFRENLLPVVDRLEDPGLICLDPLSRLLPDLNDTGGINTQEGAGIILNEMDALRTDSGCSVITSHHVSKESIRNKGELSLTAATGSQQLVDLSRWVMNLARLTPSEASNYGLGSGHYLEAAVTKSNYTPPQDDRLVFQRCAGGALSHVIVEGSFARDEEWALKILRDVGEWSSSTEWRNAGKHADEPLSKGRIDAARTSLMNGGEVVSVHWKKGRTSCTSYAPGDWKSSGWPAPPTDC